MRSVTAESDLQRNGVTNPPTNSPQFLAHWPGHRRCIGVVRHEHRTSVLHMGDLQRDECGFQLARLHITHTLVPDPSSLAHPTAGLGLDDHFVRSSVLRHSAPGPRILGRTTLHLRPRAGFPHLRHLLFHRLAKDCHGWNKSRTALYSTSIIRGSEIWLLDQTLYTLIVSFYHQHVPDGGMNSGSHRGKKHAS
jgi:hypothetical protein